ncbi:MAG TPA: glycine zipper domain-containing protein [Rhodocyclaceae bacterium]|nr:glycine zipper domain-containing protein [Rhodocyclaceae bacterium]
MNKTFTQSQSWRPIAVAVLVLASLSACSTNPSKQDVGTVSGAIIGGVVGSALTGGSGVGTIGGAAAGGYIGNRIGRDLERK